MKFTDKKPSQTHQRENIQRAHVVSTSDVPEGHDPRIVIQPVGRSSPRRARMLHTNSRDQHLPEEGSLVEYITSSSDEAYVIGVSAMEHDGYSPDERVVSHPTEDSLIHFDEKGDIHIITSDGTSVTVSDGSVIVNNGDTPVVTDIDVTTGSVDGTTVVTNIEKITDDSILV